MSSIGVGLIGTGYMGKCHALAWTSVHAVFGDGPMVRLEHLVEVTARNAKKQTAAGLGVGQQDSACLRRAIPGHEAAGGLEVLRGASRHAVSFDQFDDFRADRRDIRNVQRRAHPARPAHRSEMTEQTEARDVRGRADQTALGEAGAQKIIDAGWKQGEAKTPNELMQLAQMPETT